MKYAIITGGSSGIGLELAMALRGRGFHIVLAGRSEEKLREAAQKLESLKPGPCKREGQPSAVDLFPCDLTYEEECRRLHGTYQSCPVKVLIHSAGFGVYGSFASTDAGAELSMLRVHCQAAQLLMKLFLPDMERRGGGFILQVASLAGLSPGGPYMASYYAAKAYVASLVRGVAEELRAQGSPVYVGALCPGPVDTPFFERAGIGTAMRGMAPDAVAAAALKGMKRRQTIIVPGMGNRMAYLAMKWLPAGVIVSVNRRIQEKKNRRKGKNAIGKNGGGGDG
ncbi:MAG: SDR family NAD(P)-dependent oxidoreductase [Lachnospiraceae bacterium]|nr:SDR family NAD(P)-dependent oxidoreductase [Lachnospiraceae bacterium]